MFSDNTFSDNEQQIFHKKILFLRFVEFGVFFFSFFGLLFLFLSLLTQVLAVLYDASLYTRQHIPAAILEAVTFYGCSLRIPPEQQIFVWVG